MECCNIIPHPVYINITVSIFWHTLCFASLCNIPICVALTFCIRALLQGLLLQAVPFKNVQEGEVNKISDPTPPSMHWLRPPPLNSTIEPCLHTRPPLLNAPVKTPLKKQH